MMWLWSCRVNSEYARPRWIWAACERYPPGECEAMIRDGLLKRLKSVRKWGLKGSEARQSGFVAPRDEKEHVSCSEVTGG